MIRRRISHCALLVLSLCVGLSGCHHDRGIPEARPTWQGAVVPLPPPHTLRPFQASERAGLEERVAAWWSGKRVLVVCPNAARAATLLATLRLSPLTLDGGLVEWVKTPEYASLPWPLYAWFVVDVGEGPLPTWPPHLPSPHIVTLIWHDLPNQPTVDAWVTEVAQAGLETAT